MADDTPLRSLIEVHLDRYPDMLAQDLYVLLHQRALGPGHEITVPHLALELLGDEARALEIEVQEWESPTEPLDDARGLVRVHLRPYLRAGGALPRLHEAVVATAAQLHAERAGFTTYISSALAAVEALDEDEGLDAFVEFSVRDLKRVVAQALREKYPPPTHSPSYIEAYSPAYRIVLLEHLS